MTTIQGAIICGALCGIWGTLLAGLPQIVHALNVLAGITK